MPEKSTIKAARKDLAQGKSPSTAAGEFVRQEIEHVRQGKHGAKNAKQAIAIGLSEARHAGVDIPENPNRRTRKRAGTKRRTAKKSTTRARAVKKALKRQPRRAASKQALSRQAKQTARKRGATARSASAKKAARTRSRERGRSSTTKQAKRSRR